MKKLLLGLGTLATIAAPVIAVVSCSSDKDDTSTKTDTNKDKTTGSELDQAKAAFIEHTPHLTDAQKAKINGAENLDELNTETAKIIESQNAAGPGTGLVNKTDLPSIKTIIELNAITNKAIAAADNPVKLNKLFGTTSKNPGHDITATGGTWDKATLTYKVRTETLKWDFVITPKTINVDSDDVTKAIELTGDQGAGTISVDDTKVPTGVKSITLPTDVSTKLSNTNTIELTVVYEAGYTGSETITYTVSGLKAPVTFDDDVTAYQALGVMAYGNPIQVATKADGKTWAYKSATVFDDVTASDKSSKHYMVKTNDADKTLAKTLLPKVQAVFDQTLATFNSILDGLRLDPSSVTEIQEAGAKVVVAIAALEDGSKTYAETETEIETNLGKFLTDVPVNGLSKLETLGDITTTSSITLSDKEASLLKTGLPMLLKLAKTLAGLKTFN